MFEQPFRGSRAVAAGLVTPMQLRGPRFRRLFQDVYVDARVLPDLEVCSRGAAVLVEGRGVLCGYSAAEILDASCGPGSAPAEVHIVRGSQRALPGLRVRRGLLHPDEIEVAGGVPATTAVRTAFDLGRRMPECEAVVAVDALASRCGFAVTDVIELAARHPGARGTASLMRVLAMSDPRSGSPMESRIRLAVAAGGLPVPDLQHPVGPYALDLAYPAVLLGIEYDGRDHLTPDRARRDLDRQAFLTSRGWRILRLRAFEVHRPALVVALVREELLQIARRKQVPLSHLLAAIRSADA